MFSQGLQSLIAGIAVGAVAGYLGSLMVSKRMALVGDALGHVALPGMGIALLLEVDPSIGAFVFLFAGIVIIWRLDELTLLSVETLVGIVFVTSLAFGFIVVPNHELLESLIGDISKITQNGMIFSVIVSILAAVLVRHIYKSMVLYNISPDLAVIEGVPTRQYNFMYLFSIVLVVAVGVKVTGSLLVGALVIIPPATARIVASDLNTYIRMSVIFGVLSSVIGITSANTTGIPAGPSIILAGATLFLGTFIFKTASGQKRVASN